jgi:transcription antitermination factor NusG
MSKKWFIIFTKPRNELKVLGRLLFIGVEAYTPSRVELREWSDRKKKVTVPLLPSMVLVQLGEKEVNKIFEIPGVVRYLFEYGKRAEVSNEEVLAMQAHVANTFSVQDNKLVAGDTIQVPLLDQEALLLSLKGKNCIAQLKKLGAVVTFQLK